MSTSKEYITYLLDQCSGLGEVRCRPMMGEYLLYYRDRLAGDVCNNRLFLKPVPAARALLPDAPLEPPYTGAKPMLVVEEVDNRVLLEALLPAIYPELSPPKAKKPRKPKPPKA